MDHELDGWDITRSDAADWLPWGEGDAARARILGSADGYVVAIVEAAAGYRGTPHEHDHAEFFYLIDGTVQNQGQALHRGDGYAAAPGSVHTDFTAVTDATYLSVFRI